jgi:hypothetical protein
MASHVEVIKLVAKVAVVADAGEEVQQELGCTEADQNADCERRKRLIAAFIIGNSRKQRTSPPKLVLGEYSFRVSFRITLRLSLLSPAKSAIQ